MSAVSRAAEAEIATRLVRRVHEGDRNAEAELFERYSAGLLYMLRRLAGNVELAEDLHQETFRIVLERLRDRGLEEPAGLAGFLRGTARNLVLADRRKTIRRQTEGDEAVIEGAADPSPGQLQAVLQAEEVNVVRQLIGELPSDRDRQMLYRFYIAEEDKGPICADLGLSSLHFNRVLFRARQRLKQLLKRFDQRSRTAAPQTTRNRSEMLSASRTVSS